jgi:hypothetical protein
MKHNPETKVSDYYKCKRKSFTTNAESLIKTYSIQNAMSEQNSNDAPYMLWDVNEFNTSNQSNQSNVIGQSTLFNEPIKEKNVPVKKLLEDFFYAVSLVSNYLYPLEDQQADIIMAQITSCIPNIFGDSILDHFDYLRNVLKYDDISKIKKDLVIAMRRRGGKTLATCIFMACIMCTMEKQTILFYSTGSRISEMGKSLMLDIIKFLETQPRFSGNISWHTKGECVSVKNKYSTGEAWFYPCNVRVCIFFIYNSLKSQTQRSMEN